MKRRPVPGEPDLPLAPQLAFVDIDLDPKGSERFADPWPLRRGNEQIDIEVVRLARRPVVTCRQGTAESVRNLRRHQAAVQCRDAVGQVSGSEAQTAGSSETAWLAMMRPSGSHLRLTSARRAQVSGGRIASASQGRSEKLK